VFSLNKLSTAYARSWCVPFNFCPFWFAWTVAIYWII